MEKLIERIENTGWSVEKEGNNEYRIGKFSPSGQDFSVTIEGDSTKELIDSIYEAYVDYAISEETYLWLDDSGHGANGAPYLMRDVLEDMEACKQMIVELYGELSE